MHNQGPPTPYAPSGACSRPHGWPCAPGCAGCPRPSPAAPRGPSPSGTCAPGPSRSCRRYCGAALARGRLGTCPTVGECVLDVGGRSRMPTQPHAAGRTGLYRREASARGVVPRSGDVAYQRQVRTLNSRGAILGGIDTAFTSGLGS